MSSNCFTGHVRGGEDEGKRLDKKKERKKRAKRNSDEGSTCCRNYCSSKVPMFACKT